MVFGPNGFLKRLCDLTFALGALIFLAPVFLTLALMVYLDDGWPIFYIHERVGRNGKRFPFFKFRTMVKDADKHTYEVEQDSITRTGRFLRRWSLDETPQLLNILRGEMSFIGPRPTLQYQVDAYTPRQRRRLEVRPGVTGLAQVRGRNRLTWPQRIECDVEYIDNYSLWLDFQILLKTFNAVVNPDGIYGHGWAKQDGEPGAAPGGQETP